MYKIRAFKILIFLCIKWYAYCISINENVTRINLAAEGGYTAFMESQPSVWSGGRQYALFYWIYLNHAADIKTLMQSVSIVADLQSHITAVTPDGSTDSQILAGVGFGYQLYMKMHPENTNLFNYYTRKGNLGNLPATGGDIFIHAKSNNLGNLFKLCEHMSNKLGSRVINATDIYGFTYMKNRDLTGFIDGTANPQGDDDRQAVAVVPETGGSYVLTQQWVHDLNKKNTLENFTLESYVGRTMRDSSELRNKSASCHVARVAGGTEFSITPPFKIVRHSMPYGQMSKEAGLFFIAYSSSVASFDFMLNRMVGNRDNLPDDIMRLTVCVTGNYWYFPGVKELRDMV